MHQITTFAASLCMWRLSGASCEPTMATARASCPIVSPRYAARASASSMSMCSCSLLRSPIHCCGADGGEHATMLMLTWAKSCVHVHMTAHACGCVSRRAMLSHMSSSTSR